MSNSKTIDDGGSAFPIVAMETNEHGIVFPFITPGLSVRDWFASQALAGMSGVWLEQERDGVSAKEQVSGINAMAKYSYFIADAMIAARKAGAA